jgi:hypothetical protein
VQGSLTVTPDGKGASQPHSVFPREVASGVAPTNRARWLVAVFGGTEQSGSWRLGRHVRIVAVLGGAKVTLGTAELEAPESFITVVAFLGGADILAPPGISIQLSGFSLLGGKSDKRAGGPPLPGSPLIRVRAFAALAVSRSRSARSAATCSTRSGHAAKADSRDLTAQTSPAPEGPGLAARGPLPHLSLFPQSRSAVTSASYRAV